MRPILLTLGLALLVLPLSTLAHDETPELPTASLEQIMAGVGWSFDAGVKTEQLDDGFYVLYGAGGNIVVSSGEDGVLMVDDQFPQVAPKLRKAMRKQGDRSVDFVINTHWHFDHAQGNVAWGKEDAWLVSQAHSRQMLMSDQQIRMGTVVYRQDALPPHAWPDITFDTGMQFHINGERIDLLHVGPAHTAGDAVVIFRSHNAVHMGDVFKSSGYPFIDADNGGSIDGMIAFCEAVLAEIDEDTVVIPGHGHVAGYTDLQNYIHMLKTIRGEIVAMIRAGKTLEEIQAAGITATWDERMGKSAYFLDRAWTSLTRRYIP